MVNRENFCFFWGNRKPIFWGWLLELNIMELAEAILFASFQLKSTVLNLDRRPFGFELAIFSFGALGRTRKTERNQWHGFLSMMAMASSWNFGNRNKFLGAEQSHSIETARKKLLRRHGILGWIHFACEFDWTWYAFFFGLNPKPSSYQIPKPWVSREGPRFSWFCQQMSSHPCRIWEPDLHPSVVPCCHQPSILLVLQESGHGCFCDRFSRSCRTVRNQGAFGFHFL